MSNNNKVTPKIGSLHYIWHFEMLTTKMCCFVVVVVLSFHCGYIVVVVLLFHCGLSLFFDPCYCCVIAISSLFFDLFCFLCDPFYLCCVVVVCVVVLLLFVWLCCCCCCCFVVVYCCGFDVVYCCGFIVVL